MIDYVQPLFDFDQDLQGPGGADMVGILDLNGYFIGTTVEDALQELGAGGGGGGGGDGIYVGTDPPPSPTVGMRWLADDGTEYTYVNDGNSFQWVELGPYNVGTTDEVIDGGIYS